MSRSIEKRVARLESRYATFYHAFYARENRKDRIALRNKAHKSALDKARAWHKKFAKDRGSLARLGRLVSALSTQKKHIIFLSTNEAQKFYQWVKRDFRRGK